MDSLLIRLIFNFFYNLRKLPIFKDAPGNFYWEDLYNASPNAKVILTIRDSDEIWWNSFINFQKNISGNLLGNPWYFVFNTLQE